MNVSDVLSTTMASLRSRGLGLAGIWLAFTVLLIVAMMAMGVVLGVGAMAAGGMGLQEQGFGTGMGFGMLAGLAVFYVVYILIYMAQALAMAYYASPLVEGDVGASFGVGFRGSITMLGVVILLGLAYFVIAILAGLLGAGLAMLGEAAAVVYVLVLAPAAIYLMCRLCILMPVVAVDGVRNPVTAISRTWNLTGGKVLSIFLSLLAYIVAAIVIFGAMFAAFFGSIESYQQSALAGAAPDFGAMIGFLVAFMVVGLVFAAAGAALVSAVHSKLSDMGTETLSETFG